MMETKETLYSAQTRVCLMRRGFTQEDIWRTTLGPAAWLRVSASDGPIDAPEYMPAGAMRSVPPRWGGGMQCTAFRDI